MPVAVEGHRLAVALKISAGRGEVVERRFALHEAQLHQATGRVVDVNQQRAARTALLEPGVLAAVDLNQFAEALAPVARLMRHPDSLSPRDPDASADQPDPQRFLGDPEIVQFEELLAGQRGTEVGVALLSGDATSPKADISTWPEAASAEADARRGISARRGAPPPAPRLAPQ